MNLPLESCRYPKSDIAGACYCRSRLSLSLAPVAAGHITSETDAILARGLCGAAIAETPDLASRAGYHGVGPLLLVLAGARMFRDEALARAMWELRHRHILSQLLRSAAVAGIRCVLMKGSGFAYDLYPEPWLRPRGDSDLLVAPEDLDKFRAILTEQGFLPFFDKAVAPDRGRSQEPWALEAPDGSSHEIDLHWQPLNGAAMESVLPTAEALRAAVPLPRLCPEALTLSHPHSFLHACIHRARHILSPYFVGGEAHYGGDRLIWLYDIDLLVRTMTPQDWVVALDRAEAAGVGPVCRAALADAARLLGTRAPDAVLARLASASEGALSDYLLHSGRAAQALADLKSLDWRRAMREGAYRLFPPKGYCV